MRYAIELRNSNPFKDQEIEGYVRETEEGTYAVKGVASIKNADYIPFFATKRDALFALKRLPEALLERYDATVAQVPGY